MIGLTSYIVSMTVLTTLVASQGAQELCTTEYNYEYFIQNIMETTEIGTVIGYLKINGDDSDIALQQQTANEYYLFEPSSRNVTVVKELDTDNGAPDLPDLVVQCIKRNGSDTRPISITIHIIVQDYNDNRPQFNSDHHNVSIPEDSLIGTTVYSNAVATDKDKEFDGNSRISYRIVAGQNYSNFFRIDVPTKPMITLARELDYETTSEMYILIEAYDSPSVGRGIPLTSTATLNIYITDVDDLNPKFSLKNYNGQIREDAPTGTTVEMRDKIVARDPDSMNVSVAYRLLDPYEMFAINATTAVVYNTKPLYVDVPTVTVVVLASQVDNENREWFAMLTISITEANINAPRFSQQVYQVTKTELEPVYAVLVATTATDIDFKSVTGTVIKYAIVEDVTDLSIDNSGRIILQKALDYEREKQRDIRVTASDGSNTATATIQITVLDVNDNNPVIQTSGTKFWVERKQNSLVTVVTATDADVDDVLSFRLGNYQQEFTIDEQGQIHIKAAAEQLIRDEYFLPVIVRDNGTTPRETSTQIQIIFPTLGYVPPTTPASGRPTTPAVAAASVGVPEDNMLTIIIGAVAGVLLVIILILIVYIVWRNKRTKEELDRARAPKGYAAKGLTYRQAESPDDLPKMDLHYSDDTDGTVSEFDGGTSIQENPIGDSGLNKGYIQSSGSEMDRSVSEIHVETAVIPYDDDYGYPSDRSDYHGQLHTYENDDTASSGSNVSDSTGGSRHILVNEENSGGSKLTSWDSDDKIHPQGSKKLLDSNIIIPSTKVKKEKPEITVYF